MKAFCIRGLRPVKRIRLNYIITPLPGEGVYCFYGEMAMNEKRLAQIGIIVDDRNSAAELNTLLTRYGEYIVGRMGLPLPERGVNIISIVIDASGDVINALPGKIGSLHGVSATTLYAKV